MLKSKGNLCHDSDMVDEYLSAHEAAHKLKVHERTVRRLLACGELPGRRLGGQWRISADALKRFMEAMPEPKPPASEKPARKPTRKQGRGRM